MKAFLDLLCCVQATDWASRYYFKARSGIISDWCDHSITRATVQNGLLLHVLEHESAAYDAYVRNLDGVFPHHGLFERGNHSPGELQLRGPRAEQSEATPHKRVGELQVFAGGLYFHVTIIAVFR